MYCEGLSFLVVDQSLLAYVHSQQVSFIMLLFKSFNRDRFWTAVKSMLLNFSYLKLLSWIYLRYYLRADFHDDDIPQGFLGMVFRSQRIAERIPFNHYLLETTIKLTDYVIYCIVIFSVLSNVSDVKGHQQTYAHSYSLYIC